MASSSNSSQQEAVMRRQNNGPPFKFLVPLIYAPVLPLIRIGLRKNPVVRDRLFTAVLAGAFAHGFYLFKHDEIAGFSSLEFCSTGSRSVRSKMKSITCSSKRRRLRAQVNRRGKKTYGVVLLTFRDLTRELTRAEAQVSVAVTCSPAQLSSCVSAITSSTPPSRLCCSKIKEQKPCLCQYLRNPNLMKFINTPNARKVASTCGTPFPKC